MDFILFLIVNATLFLRPGELVPSLADVPIYNITIIAALAAAAPRVVDRLRPASLAREPVTACVLGLVPAVILSHMVRLETLPARTCAWEFSKLVIYYLLLVTVVDSLARLRMFLYCIAVFTAAIAALAVLQFHGYVDIRSLTALEHEEELNVETGELIVFTRLRATGIFHDPNDLSTIAVLAMVICTMGLFDGRFGLFRVAWLAPIVLFLVTLALTKSRGGLLACLAAGATLSYFRFGLWRTAIVACLVLPAVLFAGGRQADVRAALKSGTGASRVELWSDGLTALRRSPLFGIGCENYAEEFGQVAHNSFVHCFVELGLYGGTLFLGAFWFSGFGLWRLHREFRRRSGRLAGTAFRRMLPYLFSIVACSAVSQFTLSRCYVVPTYLVFGVANAYCLESRRRGLPSMVRVTPGRAVQLLALSAAFLAATYLFIRLGFR